MKRLFNVVYIAAFLSNRNQVMILNLLMAQRDLLIEIFRYNNRLKGAAKVGNSCEFQILCVIVIV